MSRLPLSNAAEEPIFQREDAACEACGAAMKAAIRARFTAAGASMHRPSLAMALAYAAPTAIRLAFDHRAAAHVWASAMVADERFAGKARTKPTANEADVIDGALDAGMEIGLEKLPAKIRNAVDVDAARALARKRLFAGTFRQTVAEYEESVRGLEVLARSAAGPAMKTLLDVERLASMFGLNARQAASIVKQAETLYNYGPKNTAKRLAAIRRTMMEQVQKALEARAETAGQTLARQAISTAQQALFETAKRQGLLDPDVTEREWIARRSKGRLATNVCRRCAAFDKKRAAIGELFVSDTGETAYQTGIHPLCQCSIRLVPVKTPKRQTRRRAA